jgi:hypothetical protein
MASHHDAEIVLKLYDLRREEVMRKARNFMSTQFWPTSAADIVKIMQDFGSEQNAYYRQVTSFWDMAATLVHRGALDPDLFSDWSNELFFVFAKIHPYLDDVRKQTESPKWMHNVYSFIDSKPEYQTKFETITKRVANMSKRFATNAS